MKRVFLALTLLMSSGVPCVAYVPMNSDNDREIAQNLYFEDLEQRLRMLEARLQALERSNRLQQQPNNATSQQPKQWVCVAKCSDWSARGFDYKYGRAKTSLEAKIKAEAECHWPNDLIGSSNEIECSPEY